MSYWTGALLAPLFLAFALTVMRMLPIALSLVGLKLGAHTVAFIGWFGPRGLASVLFLLIVMQSTDLMRESELLAAVALTVTLSIILHGITAAPWARIYGRSVGEQNGSGNDLT